MQDLRLDSSTRQKSHGTKSTEERMDTSNTLHPLQWTLRNRPTSLFVLPICKCGLGPNPLLGELQCVAVTASGRPSADQSMVGRGSKKKCQSLNADDSMGVVIYTFWNIWNETNRRIFNNTAETVPQVATRIKESMEQRNTLSSFYFYPCGKCFPCVLLLPGSLIPFWSVLLLVHKLFLYLNWKAELLPLLAWTTCESESELPEGSLAKGRLEWIEMQQVLTLIQRRGGCRISSLEGRQHPNMPWQLLTA